jgi:hypothetical protein
MEFTMPERVVYAETEKDDKIDLKDLGKIGNALKEHFLRYPDLLIPYHTEDKKGPQRNDL